MKAAIPLTTLVNNLLVLLSLKICLIFRNKAFILSLFRLIDLISYAPYGARFPTSDSAALYCLTSFSRFVLPSVGVSRLPGSFSQPALNLCYFSAFHLYVFFVILLCSMLSSDQKQFLLDRPVCAGGRL